MHPSAGEDRTIDMRRLAKMAVAMLPAILAGAEAQGAPQDFQSAAGQVTLLELYTSEGCSSCPPAEAWLGGLKDSSGWWKNIVPVAFHVDYWDYLGWHDPWATKAFSERQRAYAVAWGTGQIYTPGFVRNGREWKEWGASGDPSEHSATQPGVLRAASTDGREWKITFTPGEGCTCDFEVHAALLGSAMRSNVKAGENSGRQLVHDFVALMLVQSPMQKDGEKREASVKFAGDPPKDPGKTAVAIWVTHAGEIVPLQATGGWLGQ